MTIENRSYKAESNAATMTLQNKDTLAKANKFLSTQIMEAIQFPMDRNGVRKLHACCAGHMSSPNKVEETFVETDYRRFNNRK